MAKKQFLIKTDEAGFPENLIFEGGQAIEEALEGALKIQFVRIAGSYNQKKENWAQKGRCIPEIGCFKKDRIFEFLEILSNSGESFRLKVTSESEETDYYTFLFCERCAIKM